MILAELEVFHSRPIAPTRRVALGRSDLPADPAPGFGGILLGGVVAANMVGLDPDLFDDLNRLTLQLQEGRRVPQPRLRHRLQQDRVGLIRSVHRLVGDGEDLLFDLEERAAPAQNVLAAVYAAGRLRGAQRTQVLAAIRRAMRWSGQLDRSLIAHLAGLDRGAGFSTRAFGDPVAWALEILELMNGNGTAGTPDRAAVQRRFRDLVRHAHPDHGGSSTRAAQRIADLTEARRILIGHADLAG